MTMPVVLEVNYHLINLVWAWPGSEHCFLLQIHSFSSSCRLGTGPHHMCGLQDASWKGKELPWEFSSDTTLLESKSQPKLFKDT